MFLACLLAVASVAPLHYQVTEWQLRDQTDHHNELVFTCTWQPAQNERPFELTCPLVTLEDVLTGEGTAYLRLAPLPHARANTNADFVVDTQSHKIKVLDNGYPIKVVPYKGGREERIKALQDLQRTLRDYVPGRDGLFMSNTWGDRNRDARINEEFILREIEAGAALGIDVVQVDDGWQKGRSANSVRANGKGVWNGYWATAPDFWQPDPQRFPNGLAPLTRAAKVHGMKFGLWFGPDSTNDATNYLRDAEWIMKMHREWGVDYFKLDSMKTTSALALQRQQALFDKLLTDSDRKIVIDLDVTAERRPGYFGMTAAGPLFVENRYTDFHSYYPHQTLRALWSLAEVIDPVRLRMEVLNPLRNQDKYTADPLAPHSYPFATLFAIVMPCSPLGWFENSSLPHEVVSAWQPLVRKWKGERDAMFACNCIPVGERPDGVAWTGFVWMPRGTGCGYALFFRELNEQSELSFNLRKFFPTAKEIEVLSGEGAATFTTITIPRKLSYIWLKVR